MNNAETKRSPDPLQSIQNHQKRLKVEDEQSIKSPKAYRPEQVQSNDEEPLSNDGDDPAQPPTADWKTLQHMLNLIRDRKFKKLYAETGYPLGRHATTTKADTHAFRSTPLQIPNTRIERGLQCYKYYDTLTGAEISPEEYQERYEQAMEPPCDWEAYFSHLRLQKSLHQAAPTIALQIQHAREVYASKLAPKLAELRKENDETTGFHDSLDEFEAIDASSSLLKDKDGLSSV